MNPTNPQNHPLAIMLSAAVPLWILGLKQRGGPTFEEIQAVAAELEPILERADSRLLYRGKEAKEGEIAAAFNTLARGIACLSFIPGGITVFNQHYESLANTNESSTENRSEAL